MPETMVIIEQLVKAEYAKIFITSDWRLFKRMADAQFKEAAFLKKSDMEVEAAFKLLARNSRKRLLIGIGAELLLKAIYLKHGYCINKAERERSLPFPFTASDALSHETSLLETETFTLNKLIDHLFGVVQFSDRTTVLEGLKVAKVFRNKEGHVVTKTQTFNASDYRRIEASLVHLYEHAFAESLAIRFSMAPHEKPTWRISRIS